MKFFLLPQQNKKGKKTKKNFLTSFVLYSFSWYYCHDHDNISHQPKLTTKQKPSEKFTLYISICETFKPMKSIFHKVEVCINFPTIG